MDENIVDGAVPADPAGDNISEVALALRSRDDRIRQEVSSEILAALTEQGLGRERAHAGEAREVVSAEATLSRDTRVPAREGARVTRVSDYRYASIPLNLGGDVRSPEGDLEIKDFVMALMRQDSIAMQRIQAKVREDYRKRQLVVAPTDPDSGLATGSGGPLVPLPLSNLLMTILQRNATMRQIGQVFDSPAMTLRVAHQDQHATAFWTGENATINSSEANYQDRLLTKRKLTVLTIASNEMISDSAFNVASLIASEAGQTMAATEDASLATSTGAPNEPTQGLDAFADTLTATHEIPLAGVGTDELNLQILLNFFFGVHKPYRNGAVWAAPDAVLNLLSQLVDSNGRQILMFANEPANVVTDQYPGAVGTIFGRPVVEIPCASTRLYFGDMRRAYWILDGSPISAMVSEHAGFADDNVQFRFIRRVDGRGGSGGLPGARTFVYTDDAAAVTP